jgi:hypothetical protein
LNEFTIGSEEEKSKEKIIHKSLDMEKLNGIFTCDVITGFRYTILKGYQQKEKRFLGTLWMRH